MAKTTRHIVHVQGRELSLGNLEKVLYPACGFTKAQVLDYYRRVSPWLLPHLRARPLTLKRYPEGVENESFYEKRCPSHRPDWMFTTLVHHAGGTDLRYCAIVDLPSLMWVVNLASLELHVLLSRGFAPKRPTAVAFDLDPGPPAGLREAGEVALLLRRVLEGAGLQSVVKVSGRKGLHLYVPLNTPTGFEQTKCFARTLAQMMEHHYGDKATSQMAKERRVGKVFIDWSQNDEHKTTVCVYSLRPTDVPQVSAPVSWDELEKAVRTGRTEDLVFSPDEVIERLEADGDLFQPILTVRQHLPALGGEDIGSIRTWQSKGPSGRPNAKAARAEKSSAPANESLSAYRRKRDFARTPEPGGEVLWPAGAKEQGIFVVQKHAARRLHYDFRLECGGVLKSWAVPKGPSLNPRDKRLAVRVEDHPLDYAQFEGEIPEKQYGAGEVIVWDTGVFSLAHGLDASAMEEELAKGKLEIRLEGVKLRGTFILARTAMERERGKENWLLMKKKDDAADAHADPVQTEPYSVLSGLWVEDLAEAVSGRSLSTQGRQPWVNGPKKTNGSTSTSRRASVSAARRVGPRKSPPAL